MSPATLSALPLRSRASCLDGAVPANWYDNVIVAGQAVPESNGQRHGEASQRGQRSAYRTSVASRSTPASAATLTVQATRSDSSSARASRSPARSAFATSPTSSTSRRNVPSTPRARSRAPNVMAIWSCNLRMSTSASPGRGRSENGRETPGTRERSHRLCGCKLFRPRSGATPSLRAWHDSGQAERSD